MGYSDVFKAYRLIDVSTGKITISRDVKFLNSFCKASSGKSPSPSSEMLVPLLDEAAGVVPAEIPADCPAVIEVLRRSTRSTKGQLPARYACLAEAVVQEEPKTLKEALASPDSSNWRKAMLEELDSMASNDAWDLVEAPQGKRVLGCKWVYQLKRTANQKIVRFKARLVAQGYIQQYGSEYDEVFAPVVRQTTFRTLMSVAGKRGMVVRQYDI